MAKDRDEDAERNPETQGSIDQRRKRRFELSKEYKEARQELPDNPRDDPWAYTEFPTQNPADTNIPPLWERIQSSARTVRQSHKHEDGSEIPPSHKLAETLGKVPLHPHYWHPGINDNLTQNLNGEEATRLYLFFDLSPLKNQSKVVEKIDNPHFRKLLGISNSVSQPTLNRTPGRMDPERRHFYASETETLVRQWENTPFEDWVRPPTPETVVTDGEGFPPVQVIARDLRSKTFKYIRLKRDDSTEVTKDAALRALIAAANGNEFVNDAAKNLKYKPFYDDGDILTGQNLTHHLRKSFREAVTRMFREVNEQLFEIADNHEYFSNS